MLLALETATDVCSAALWKDGRVRAHATIDRPRAHAEWLVPLAQDLLRWTGSSPTDLDAVALSAGPGSYTGLRIGTSAAKGLCAALGVPLVAVPTLEALALQAAPLVDPHDLLLPAFDARRGHVYAALYRPAGDRLEELASATALPAADVADALGLPTDARIWTMGDGASLVRDALSGRNVSVLPVRPSATTVAQIGAALHQAERHADLDAFEPDYVRSYTPKKGGSVFDKIPF